MGQIRKADIARYVILPGVFPRIKTLFGSGLGYIPFFVAHVFRGARLLPVNHPYLRGVNFGRYSTKQVLAEACNNLVISKNNIDQILIFGMILFGMVLLFLQLCMLGIAVFTQSAAFAAPPLFNFFATPAPPTDDIAYMLMDRVFGLDVAFFGSCVSQGVNCFTTTILPAGVPPDGPYPSAFHDGLHAMLQVYSIGLLVIAMLILSYLMVSVFLETAEHGTPFGRRYNKLYVPIRIVLAMALLIPIANGLNAAQFLVIYAAKYGSNFATNGWTLFTTTALGGVGSTLAGQEADLVALPNTPPVNTLMEFGAILGTCIIAERSRQSGPRNIQAWAIFPNQATLANQRIPLAGLPFATAITRSNMGDIIYRFGVYEEKGGQPVHNGHVGAVKPVCGEIMLQVTDVDDIGSPGSREILEGYHDMILRLWDDALTGGVFFSVATTSFFDIGAAVSRRHLPRIIVNPGTEEANDRNAPIPDAATLTSVREEYATILTNIIAGGVATQRATADWNFGTYGGFGWAGAGIWYNRIARLNGAVMSSAYALPVVRRYPEVMEYVRKERERNNAEVTGSERHNPALAFDEAVRFPAPGDAAVAEALYRAQTLWSDSIGTTSTSRGNIFIDAINLIFGTQALFSMTQNSNIHPLAQLVAIGRGLMDASIRNLGYSIGGTVAGGLMNIVSTHLGTLTSTAADFAKQVAFVGMSTGFVLYYVLPFLPFLYFFFAVGGWIKGVFEAMVGVPLWALAHIRIDGDSLPGDAARGGYYLLLDIFLRPILIIFALIMGILVFSAQAKVLNEIWGLVTSNVGGFDVNNMGAAVVGEIGSARFLRSVVDRLFYTVMYAIVIYMAGVASFKLVDVLPQHIMRWMGADAEIFNDKNSRSPEGIMGTMTVGSRSVIGGLNEVSSGAKGAATNLTNALKS